MVIHKLLLGEIVEYKLKEEEWSLFKKVLLGKETVVRGSQWIIVWILSFPLCRME